MFFWSVFWKRTKKVIYCQKRHFGCFWLLIAVFLCVFKDSEPNNICASFVFKAKTKEKLQIFFYSFYLKTQKCPFHFWTLLWKWHVKRCCFTSKQWTANWFYIIEILFQRAIIIFLIWVVSINWTLLSQISSTVYTAVQKAGLRNV